MSHSLLTFLIGCIGGLGVNLYRLYRVSQSPKETAPAFNAIYWAQFFGMALMGGAVAWINDLTKEVSPLTAFNLGLSVPAIINTGAGLEARRAAKKTPPRVN